MIETSTIPELQSNENIIRKPRVRVHGVSCINAMAIIYKHTSEQNHVRCCIIHTLVFLTDESPQGCQIGHKRVTMQNYNLAIGGCYH